MEVIAKIAIIKDGRVLLIDNDLPELKIEGEGELLDIIERKFTRVYGAKIRAFYAFYHVAEDNKLYIYVSAVNDDNIDFGEFKEIDKVAEENPAIKRYLHYLYIFERFFNSDE